ncbi:shikimate kinase [Sporomusa sphaeroides]|uniref:shikimate kinase n=1 Tax=Sporomusa sphaeroides TaxID=47679 RepID=UPI002BC09C89|nr:shikimate kinase [Sporomusa sphaeroides]HML31354.1 shikimate kinase [Sporomusa sphaeroides]
MKNIVLIGFMGTGKTSTGRLLAGRLNRPFVDVDKKIEKETGLAISDIFQLYGEDHFRQLEREVISRVARYTNTIIATGGGVVLKQENMVRLKNTGIIISLTASLDTILERTSRRGVRPLLDCEDRAERVARLFQERASLYMRADYTIDTSCMPPHQVTEKIIGLLREGGYLRGRSKS